MNHITRFLVLIVVLYANNVMGQSTAIYDITFTSIWNASDHTYIPPNAHWSKLVGTTHKTENTFFQVGAAATTGVKNIAETGNNTVFSSEVTTQITNLEADQYIDGPSLSTAAGEMEIFNLEVSEDFHLLTLVSMIAPSPDWLIGVNGFDFFDAGNNWKTSETIDIFALDAGTDDGIDYTSSNVISAPFQPISVKSGVPFQGNKIGTLTITLKGFVGLDDNFVFQGVNIYPNPVKEKLNIINTTGTPIKEVEVYNLSGAKIKSYSENLTQGNLILDVQYLTSGVYFLKLVSDFDKFVVKKLIIE